MKKKKLNTLLKTFLVFGLITILSLPSFLYPTKTQVAAQATGGTYTEVGGYGIHTFTSSGDFIVSSGGDVDILLVAGGGSGGNARGGGGGGGGVLVHTGEAVTAQTYGIVVGAGGTDQGTYKQGGPGGNTTGLGKTAIGGGGGGGMSVDNYEGADGGCGGGGSSATGIGYGGDGSQGGDGGDGYRINTYWSAAGGGGVAPENGDTGLITKAGNGGEGLSNSYSGGAVIYGSGGGGGWARVGAAGGGEPGWGGTNAGNGAESSDTTCVALTTAALANKGGGGGGGAYASAGSCRFPGAGGSGVVIIRYLLPPPPDAPTIDTATVLSDTSIQWNFTDNASDETGFKVYDTSNNLKVTCASPNLSSCTETGLDPNTSYTRKVVAYSDGGNSSYSSTDTASTLATSCLPALGDSTHFITEDCSFSGYTDATNGDRIVSGLESGTGTTNTSVLTIQSGTLTINANETLVVGSIVLTGGSIASAAAGGKIITDANLWAIDADTDGYPFTTTFYAQINAPTNGVRLSTITNIATADCDDENENVSNLCATGGTYTEVGGYGIHTFTSSGTFTSLIPMNVEVLVVGGGGSGHGTYNMGGGGGGGGGVLHKAVHPVTARAHAITVGAGGVNVYNYSPGGTAGGSSYFDGTLQGMGGGKSNQRPEVYQRNGGSAGGASPRDPGLAGGASTQTSNNGGIGYGNSGGPYVQASPYYSGGGGGAGTAGVNRWAGAGKAFSTSGSSIYYGGGGGTCASNGSVGDGGIGGGADGCSGCTNHGTNGLGGGGGGARNATGGSGGSGVVIIRYLLP